MTHSKLSRWVKRSAFALIACAAFAMISAEQAQAQYYGGRGGGFSITIGNGGYGNYGGYGGGYNNYNSGYRYVPQRSYYRGGGGYGGGGSYGRGYSSYGRGGGSYGRGGGSYGRSHYSRGRY